MNPTEAISSLSDVLDTRLAVPVRTSGLEGERPVPLVLIDDWQITELEFHNSGFAGQTRDVDVDGDGETEHARWYRFYYDMRVDLEVRDSDDVGAHTLLGEVQSVLIDLKQAPREHLHDHINTLSLGSSGNPTYQFAEPKETELRQSFSLRSFHQVSRTDFDTIQDVQTQFTTQP
jgi:hypothetical protein